MVSMILLMLIQLLWRVWISHNLFLHVKWNMFVMVLFCKVLISYIDTAGSTMTRQKALTEQYLFTCTCPRCIKAVPANILFLGFSFYCWTYSILFYIGKPDLLLVNLANFVLKGQSDDIQESAILEGYQCKDYQCNGFLLRSSGRWFSAINESDYYKRKVQLVGQSSYFGSFAIWICRWKRIYMPTLWSC